MSSTKKTIRVVAAVIRDGDRIFATARGYGEYKGWWEFPGGKIEAGETPEEALVREIREELETEIEVGDFIQKIEYDYPEFHLSMDCFWATVKSGHLELKEAEDAKWLTVDTLYDVKWLPADEELIEAIKLILAKQQLLSEVKNYIEQHFLPEDLCCESAPFILSDLIATHEEDAEEPVAYCGHPTDGEPETPKLMLEFSAVKSSSLGRSPKKPAGAPRRLDDLIDQLDETFSQRLLRLIRERDLIEAEVYKRAYVDRRHFSKIKNDPDYTPNKKTAIAFAIALELSLDETKDLLGAAGYALSRSSKFDVIIMYFLENQIYDLFEINDVLFHFEQPIFE
jgi:8-oxo-dGTP diphosphatase